MTFQKDLAFGQSYEKLAQSYFTYDKIEFAPDCRFKEYDFKITKDDLETKLEVKADKQAYLTKNICIEYECNGRPSGLTTTSSDYYMYFVIDPENGDDVYQIPTKYIRELINKNNFRKIKGGDRGSSVMYLINIQHFDDYKVFLYECY